MLILVKHDFFITSGPGFLIKSRKTSFYRDVLVYLSRSIKVFGFVLDEILNSNLMTPCRLFILEVVTNRIYDGVEAETRKSQASFQII